MNTEWAKALAEERRATRKVLRALRELQEFACVTFCEAHDPDKVHHAPECRKARWVIRDAEFNAAPGA